MITLFTGSMGSGKTYTSVQQILLPNLKNGRVICTNITGLDREKIAKFLGLDVDDVNKRLLTFDDDEINDEFWPDEDGGGKVPHGSILILDEAWKFTRTKEQLTPRLMDYIRRHRKWSGGEPPVSCEIVLVTQSKTDLHKAIKDVTDQVYVIRKNRFSGFNSLYQMALYQPGQRQALSASNHKYDKRIFPLYKSHNNSGVIEQSADKKGSFLYSRKTWLAAVCVAVSLVGVPVLASKLLAGTFMPAPRSSKKPAAAPVTAVSQPVSPPSNLAAQPVSFTPVGQNVTATSIPSSSPPLGSGAPIPPNVYYRVLSLKGDPDAVLRVGEAYCSRAQTCQAVVNPASQQVVLVGDEKAVDRLEKLLASLAVRPAGQLVKLVVFELDETKEDDFNLFLTSRSGSLQAGFNNGAGTVGVLKLGDFAVGFQKLVGNGAVKVISQPSVMIWPGQTSTIKSGLSVPILGSIITDSAGRQTQVLDYRDSGLILNLSEISTGDRPVLKIDIESSSYGNTVVGVTAQPTKSERVLNTMAELPACSVTVLGGIDQILTDQQKQTFLGFQTGKTATTKMSKVYIALMSSGGGASEQACEATAPSASKAS